MDQLKKEVGARLKAIRQAQGITQQELEKRTGIKQPNIFKIEAGTVNATLDTIQRLATALKQTTAIKFSKTKS